MTDAELSSLEAAAKAATRGPWIRKNRNVYHAYDNGTYCDVPVCEANFGATAAYIAAASSDKILELIAELRQTRAERDWLAENMPNSYPECHCPEGHYKSDCNPTPTAGGKVCYDCLLCWLRAAREAVCQK